MTLLPNATVALVGAGYLGTAFADAWPGAVLAATRSGRWRTPPGPAGATVVPLDVTASTLALHRLTEAEALVIAYAPGRDQDRRALYLEGTRRLLETWGPGRLRRIVWVGSTSALPDRDAWLDERCEDWPEHTRGRVQREAEQVVAAHARRHAIPWLSLRLGGLYGPERGLDRIYRRRREGPLPGDGMAPTNLIHRDDAVQAIGAALEAPAAVQGVVHVVDDEHTPRRQMYARMARILDAPPVRWAEPVPARAIPRGKRVSNRRLKHCLGVTLRYPTHHLG